jgi:hypothetical protein
VAPAHGCGRSPVSALRHRRLTTAKQLQRGAPCYQGADRCRCNVSPSNRIRRDVIHHIIRNVTCRNFRNHIGFPEVVLKVGLSESERDSFRACCSPRYRPSCVALGYLGRNRDAPGVPKDMLVHPDT